MATTPRAGSENLARRHPGAAKAIPVSSSGLGATSSDTTGTMAVQEGEEKKKNETRGGPSNGSSAPSPVFRDGIFYSA